MKFLTLQKTTFTDGCCGDGVEAAPVVDNNPLSVSASIDTAPNYGLNIVATLNKVWPYDVTVTGKFKYKPNPVPEAYGNWSVVIPAGSLSASTYNPAGTWQHYDTYSVCISNAVDSQGVQPLYTTTVCDVTFDPPAAASSSLWAYMSKENDHTEGSGGSAYQAANFIIRLFTGAPDAHPDAATAPAYAYTGNIGYSISQDGYQSGTSTPFPVNNKTATFNNSSSYNCNLNNPNGYHFPNSNGTGDLHWYFTGQTENESWKKIKDL